MKGTLKLLILSDIFILSGFGLITPLLAIFIKDDLVGGSILAAGIAIALFWVTKSVLQIPLSIFIDTQRKKKKFLLLGTVLIIIVPFIYLSAKSVSHIYIAQLVYACGAALAYPTWMSLFTMNVDPKHRGFEWSLWSASVGIGTGIAAFIGGSLATFFSFQTVFIISGIMGLVGFLILFFIGNHHKPNKENLLHQRRIKHLKK